MIEVQTGKYLGEDDMERIQDDYPAHDTAFHPSELNGWGRWLKTLH